MARRRRARFWSIGPPQAGSISESCQVWPAAGGLEFGVLARRRRARFLRCVKSVGPPQAGSYLEYWPAAGGLDSGVLARRRRPRCLRCVGKCGPPQAGSISHDDTYTSVCVRCVCDLCLWVNTHTQNTEKGMTMAHVLQEGLWGEGILHSEHL